MLVQGYLLVVLISLQAYTCTQFQKEKIETVKLSYYCMRLQTTKEKCNKSVILLIHGLTDSKETWNGVSDVLALRTGRTVCAVDLRNHGDSPWNDRFDIPAITADIAEFLNSKKIEKVNLIGHSLGGKIAIHYTLNDPNRVNSLVVEDTRPNTISPLGSALATTLINTYKEAIENVPKGSNENEARKIIAYFLKSKMKEFGVDEEAAREIAASIGIRCTYQKCQYKFNIDVIAKVGNAEKFLIESKGLYEGPALFIYGDKSVYDIPADKENILKLFPKTQLVGVRGADHRIHGVYKKFDDEVIRFLQTLN